MQTIENLQEKLHRLQEKMSLTCWDIDRLSKMLNRSVDTERMLGALKSFTSSKNYVEVACRLDEEHATKLVDALDQVCRDDLRNNLAR